MAIDERAEVQIEDLLDRPSAIDTVVTWIDREWASFSGRTLEQTRARYSEGIRRDELPITLVAFEGDKALGLASLRVRDSIDYLPGRTPWICNVFVDDGARGRGVAAALCRVLEQKAKILGYEEIFLGTTMLENSLYHRLGFEEISRIELHGEPYALLRKEI